MSGGRYHSVTTSLEYVFVGIDLARAKPESHTTPQLHQRYVYNTVTTLVTSLHYIHFRDMFVRNSLIELIHRPQEQ